MAVTYTQNVKSGASTNLVPYSSLRSINGWIREGYTFKGWSTNSSATEPEYLDEARVQFNRNVTLYAIWEEINENRLLLESATSDNDFIELESGGALLLEN